MSVPWDEGLCFTLFFFLFFFFTCRVRSFRPVSCPCVAQNNEYERTSLSEEYLYFHLWETLLLSRLAASWRNSFPLTCWTNDSDGRFTAFEKFIYLSLALDFVGVKCHHWEGWKTSRTRFGMIHSSNAFQILTGYAQMDDKNRKTFWGARVTSWLCHSLIFLIFLCS